MEGKRLIKTLRIHNLLSFGPKGVEVELEPLNVLIGPNASGKSNLIAALDILHAVPTDVAKPFREGGGVAEWFWKGGKDGGTAEIDVTLSYMAADIPLRYRIAFIEQLQHLALRDEDVENALPIGPDEHEVSFFYKYLGGAPIVRPRISPDGRAGTAEGRTERMLSRDQLKPGQSVLTHLRDPEQYPELTYVAKQFEEIRLYRDWNLGHNSPLRRPQPADLPEDFLLEDGSNLGLVLNDLEHQDGVKQQILDKLRVFYEAIANLTVKVQGGTVQVFLHERGFSRPVPVSRLSDGTLRYLCLLVILCHPTPPPLVCIEEPELGLHPDILPTVAELLIDASRRMQLIVTTHSDILVSALSDVPECILVCDRDPEGTRLTRLKKEALKEWLEKYKLGDYWLSGGIGGTRW